MTPPEFPQGCAMTPVKPDPRAALAEARRILSRDQVRTDAEAQFHNALNYVVDALDSLLPEPEKAPAPAEYEWLARILWDAYRTACPEWCLPWDEEEAYVREVLFTGARAAVAAILPGMTKEKARDFMNDAITPNQNTHSMQDILSALRERARKGPQ